MKFDEKQKVALIKEVKNLMDGMNLVQVGTILNSYLIQILYIILQF